MKKLLLSLILVVTAFLLGGLLEVKAATTPGVTYVTEGDRVYVHFPNSMSGHNIDLSLFSQEYELNEEVYFDVPENAININFTNLSGTLITKIEINELGQLSLSHTENPSLWIFESNDCHIADEVKDGSAIYFEIESSPATTSIHFDLIYNDSVDQGELSGVLDPADFTFLSNHYQSILSTTAIITNYQDETVTLSFDHAGVHNDMNFIQLSGTYSDGEFSINFYENGDLAFYGNAVPKDGSQHVEIVFDVPPIDTAPQFDVVPVVEKFYMHLFEFMGTGGLSNVILVNSTEKIDAFTALAGSTGIPFASIDNAVSINIGYQSAGVAYDNATSYSPKKYTLNPTEEYQFYLNRDTNGLYITTDSNLWTDKWYVRTATGTYAPSVFIYFQTDRSPVLDGQVAFISNITNPMSEANIRTYISAIDDYDGDITHLIQYDGGTYESNRIANTLIPNQSYTILYSVQDSSGNETQLTVTVLVKDVTGPTFGIASPTRTVSYKDTFNVEGFKTSLLVTDNYSTAQNITITVTANTYTANKSVPGTYQITYQAADQFGNTSTKVISVTVIDNVGPVFSGVSTVVKPVQSVLTVNEIIAQVIASDEIGGNVSGSIQIVTDNYTGNGATIGNYSIIVRATDGSGNSTDYTITVQVRDSLPPVFYVKDGYFINVEDTVTLTIGDIITILERTGQLVINSTTNYTVLVNEYSGNEDIEGIYTVSIKFNSTNGTEVIKSVAVNVINTEDPTGTITPDPTFGKQLLDNWYWIVGGIVVLYIFLPKKTYTKKYNKRG